MVIWKCSLFPESKIPSVGLEMSRVPSLKDLAFLAIPSRVPSLKQLARAAVAANRPPLPAHTLARRRYVHTGDVVPRLIRRLYEAIGNAVARITHFPDDILALLTPHLEGWRRSPNSTSWKLDIPRPPPIRLRGNPRDAQLPPTEDQWQFPTPAYAWNWNTHATEYERRNDDNWERTAVRRNWQKTNWRLGKKGEQNWWNKMFPPVPLNQRRIHAEDFEIRHLFDFVQPIGNKSETSRPGYGLFRQPSP